MINEREVFMIETLFAGSFVIIIAAVVVLAVLYNIYVQLIMKKIR